MGKAKAWGKVAFRAEGLSIEKLIRLCSEQGIVLLWVKRTGIKAMDACCRVAQYAEVETLCDQRGWRLTRQGFVGARAAWERIKNHGCGLAAGVISLICMAIAMGVVWQIRVEDAGVYTGDLWWYIEDAGIHVGMPKKQIDTQQLCCELEWRYPHIAWAQADLRGSTLVIRLVEGVATPEVAPYGEAGDVVAARGGVIQSIEPMAGTPVVKPGEVVTAGQVLIKGEEKRGNGNVIPVKARGRIWARVWDRVGVEISLTQIRSEPTGQSAAVWEVGTPWKTFAFDRKPEYEWADIRVQVTPVGGCWWPVWIRQSRYEEVTIQEETRPEEDVRAEAERMVLRLLSEKMRLSDDLVDKWIDYCMIEGGKLAAYATVERRVDIGSFVPNSQESHSLAVN